MKIRKGLIIGIVGAFLTLIGDFLMGANPAAEMETGVAMLDMFADGVNNSELRMAVGGMLGVIGIPLEGVAYFQIYRMLRHAEGKGFWTGFYKTSVLAYIGLAGAGVHLACAVVAMLLKWITPTDPELAVLVASRYASYFMLPPTVIFGVLLLIALTYQTVVIARGRTAYPKSVAFCHMGIGVIAAYVVASVIGNNVLGNGISTGAISFGHLWMFGMLAYKLPEAYRELETE